MKTKGWKNVFSFTFIQTVKAKSFIVSTIIMCVIIVLMSAGINLLPGLIAGSDSSDSSTGSEIPDDGNSSAIKLVYVLDETGIEGGVDLSALGELGYNFESITAADLTNKITEVYNSAESKVIVEMTAADSGYNVLVDRPMDNAVVTSEQCSTLGSYVSSVVKTTMLMSYGVAPENVLKAQASVYSTVTIAGEEPQSLISQLVNTFVPMVSSLVLFMFIFAYGQMVAQAVAIEKTSRVMELLLTSIKPLAVIVGKVLAMCCVSLFQFILLGAAGGISFAVLLPFGALPTLTTGAVVDNVPVSVMDEIGSALSGFNPLNIALILVIFILGFLFFALVAGLIGASISKMEDLASAMQPMAILGVLGFYLAYFPSIAEMETTAGDGPNIFTLLSYYLPISSPFALPSALITGKLELYEVLISIVVLAAFVVIMAMIVAKVYQHIVLHSGNRLKLSEMLKLAKTK